LDFLWFSTGAITQKRGKWENKLQKRENSKKENGTQVIPHHPGPEEVPLAVGFETVGIDWDKLG
jgi:hypothetical protein